MELVESRTIPEMIGNFQLDDHYVEEWSNLDDPNVKQIGRKEVSKWKDPARNADVKIQRSEKVEKGEDGRKSVVRTEIHEGISPDSQFSIVRSEGERNEGGKNYKTSSQTTTSFTSISSTGVRSTSKTTSNKSTTKTITMSGGRNDDFENLKIAFKPLDTSTQRDRINMGRSGTMGIRRPPTRKISAVQNNISNSPPTTLNRPKIDSPKMSRKSAVSSPTNRNAPISFSNQSAVKNSSNSYTSHSGFSSPTNRNAPNILNNQSGLSSPTNKNAPIILNNKSGVRSPTNRNAPVSFSNQLDVSNATSKNLTNQLVVTTPKICSPATTRKSTVYSPTQRNSPNIFNKRPNDNPRSSTNSPVLERKKSAITTGINRIPIRTQSKNNVKVSRNELSDDREMKISSELINVHKIQKSFNKNDDTRPYISDVVSSDNLMEKNSDINEKLSHKILIGFPQEVQSELRTKLNSNENVSGIVSEPMDSSPSSRRRKSYETIDQNLKKNEKSRIGGSVTDFLTQLHSQAELSSSLSQNSNQSFRQLDPSDDGSKLNDFLKEETKLESPPSERSSKIMKLEYNNTSDNEKDSSKFFEKEWEKTRSSLDRLTASISKESLTKDLENITNERKSTVNSQDYPFTSRNYFDDGEKEDRNIYGIFSSQAPSLGKYAPHVSSTWIQNMKVERRVKDEEVTATISEKGKKVGFSRTEVHFMSEPGKFQIVESEENKPITSHLFRRRKKRTTENNVSSTVLDESPIEPIFSPIHILQENDNKGDLKIQKFLNELKSKSSSDENFSSLSFDSNSENEPTSFRHENNLLYEHSSFVPLATRRSLIEMKSLNDEFIRNIDTKSDNSSTYSLPNSEILNYVKFDMGDKNDELESSLISSESKDRIQRNFMSENFIQNDANFSMLKSEKPYEDHNSIYSPFNDSKSSMLKAYIQKEVRNELFGEIVKNTNEEIFRSGSNIPVPIMPNLQSLPNLRYNRNSMSPNREYSDLSYMNPKPPTPILPLQFSTFEKTGAALREKYINKVYNISDLINTNQNREGVDQNYEHNKKIYDENELESDNLESSQNLTDSKSIVRSLTFPKIVRNEPEWVIKARDKAKNRESNLEWLLIGQKNKKNNDENNIEPPWLAEFKTKTRLSPSPSNPIKEEVSLRKNPTFSWSEKTNSTQNSELKNSNSIIEIKENESKMNKTVIEENISNKNTSIVEICDSNRDYDSISIDPIQIHVRDQKTPSQDFINNLNQLKNEEKKNISTANSPKKEKNHKLSASIENTANKKILKSDSKDTAPENINQASQEIEIKVKNKKNASSSNEISKVPFEETGKSNNDANKNKKIKSIEDSLRTPLKNLPSENTLKRKEKEDILKVGRLSKNLVKPPKPPERISSLVSSKISFQISPSSSLKKSKKLEKDDKNIKESEKEKVIEPQTTIITHPTVKISKLPIRSTETRGEKTKSEKKAKNNAVPLQIVESKGSKSKSQIGIMTRSSISPLKIDEKIIKRRSEGSASPQKKR